MSILGTSPTPSSKPSYRQALEELARRRLARPDTAPVVPFPDWLPQVTPSFDWRSPHLVHVQRLLDRVTEGEIDRLMIFMPPRHGKSQMVTVRYPVWRIKRDPGFRVIVGAYGAELSQRFSRQARRLALSDGIELARDSKAVQKWETPQEGGYQAVGVGSGVTGHGGHLLIVDDPIRSRKDAESPTFRDTVWDWYREDLYSRRDVKTAPIILIQTRWHEDDLAGRLLNQDHGDPWMVCSLPALAEDDDPLGRSPGEALCPERFDVEDLARTRAVEGSYGFSALYQQRPMPAEGGMFKREWFPIVDAAPAIASRVRYWDKAGTDGDGDYTVGTRMSKTDDGIYYVEGVVRGQWSSGARTQIMQQTAALDGKAVRIWIELEGGSGGKDSGAADVKALAGYPVHLDLVTGSKAVRAEPFAAQCEAGNVRLVRGDWFGAFLDELTSFPNGTHDDQVDASSGAFNALALGGTNVVRRRKDRHERYGVA